MRDAVLLNAAAALVALDPSEEPLAPQLIAGMGRGAAVVDSGAAADVLERWIDVSQQRRLTRRSISRDRRRR